MKKKSLGLNERTQSLWSLTSMGEIILFKVKEWTLKLDCLHLIPASTAFKECNLSCQMRISLFCNIVWGLRKYKVNECKHYWPHRGFWLVFMGTKFKTKNCVIINQVNLYPQLSSLTIPRLWWLLYRHQYVHILPKT